MNKLILSLIALLALASCSSTRDSYLPQVGRYQLQQIEIPFDFIQDGKESGDRSVQIKDTLTVLLDTQEGTIYELTHKVTLIQTDSIRYHSLHNLVEIFTGYHSRYSRAIDGQYTARETVRILNAFYRATRKEEAIIRIDLQDYPSNLYQAFSDSIKFVDGKYHLK